MPRNIKTEWKRIGRSGPTVDGRNIDPSALEQAAKNYNKELFTALIWPEHERWYNMGTVEELRTAQNDEGGVDLFAIISPNDYYLSINNAGQKLFTSMELMPDFRKSGEFYLTGLAATDSPASTGTTEMRFSAINNKDALLSVFTEHAPHSFAEDQTPGWFKRFAEKFTQPDEDAMKKALEALAEKFTKLEQKLDALKPAGAADTKTPEGSMPSDDYSGLAGKVEALKEQFSALQKQLADGKDNAKDTDHFKELSDELKTLREEFNTAVNKAAGTKAGEHDGDGTNLSQYI
jgi:hypothetical protein